jgi:hypothetical protein
LGILPEWNISFPESPRWLVKAGLKAKAQIVLEKIGGEKYAEDEIASIAASLDKSDVGKKIMIGELFHGKMGYILLLGTLLAAFHKYGINAILPMRRQYLNKPGG